MTMSGHFCGNCGTMLQRSGACPQCITGSYAPLPAEDAAGGFSRVAGFAPYIPVARLPGAEFAGQWNWGAFLLTPFWLGAHGKKNLGFLSLVLWLIPGVGLVLPVIYGLNGNKLASECDAYRDTADFVASQNMWRDRGFWVAGAACLIGLMLLVFAVPIRH